MKKDNKKPGKIRYFDLYGLREEKYKFLENHDVKNTEWQDLGPKEPNYFFVPKDMRGEEIYEKFISLEDIFEKYNAGIATGKDEVLVDFDKQSLVRKLSVRDKNVFEIAMQGYGVEKDLIDKWYQELKDKDVEKQIKIYNYRPFDSRFIIYNTKVVQRARDIIMQHLLQDNLALIGMRQYIYSTPYSHVFVSKNIVDRRIFISNRGAAHVFPLYLYGPSKKFVFRGQKHLDILGVQKELDEQVQDKKPNIKKEIISKLLDVYKKHISPEEIFYYIYAILYSNVYRKKYNEFLKIDFPKIPFTKNTELFNKIVDVGKELVDLHLLKSEKLEDIGAKFLITGDNRVKERKYNQEEKRLYINDIQYFDGIEPEVWNYFIGGYQVLDKWLKDRKDKILSPEDINHLLRVITALKLTIELQKEIDKLYLKIENNL